MAVTSTAMTAAGDSESANGPGLGVTDEMNVRLSRRKKALADSGRRIYCGADLDPSMIALREQYSDSSPSAFVCKSCTPDPYIV